MINPNSKFKVGIMANSKIKPFMTHVPVWAPACPWPWSALYCSSYLCSCSILLFLQFNSTNKYCSSPNWISSLYAGNTDLVHISKGACWGPYGRGPVVWCCKCHLILSSKVFLAWYRYYKGVSMYQLLQFCSCWSCRPKLLIFTDNYCKGRIAEWDWRLSYIWTH